MKKERSYENIILIMVPALKVTNLHIIYLLFKQKLLKFLVEEEVKKEIRVKEKEIRVKEKEPDDISS